jgi:hypothetical protein
LTPARFLFVVALVASSAVTVYGLFVDRSGAQFPIAASGLAVLGLTLVILAFWLARAAVHAGRRGSMSRALFSALVGGLCALMASGALGAAVIFGAIAVGVRQSAGP